MKLIKSIYSFLNIFFIIPMIGIWVLILTTQALPDLIILVTDGIAEGTMEPEAMYAPLMFTLGGFFLIAKLSIGEYKSILTKKETKKKDIKEILEVETSNKYWTKYTTNKG